MIQRYAFLIVPDFAFYGLLPAIEALRVANYNSGQRLYDWCLVSSNGQRVTATNGMILTPDYSIANCPPLDACLVVAGNHPMDNRPTPAIKWLRRLDRLGTRLGAFDSGVFLLAEAGLLENHVSAVHWELIPIIRESYPSLRVSDQLYNIEVRRMTCAGGTSTTDFMLALVAMDYGDALAGKVARGLVHWPRRKGSERQHPIVTDDAHGELLTLTEIIELMHDTIDEPAGVGEIAERFDVSQRFLENLFRRHLNTVPATYFRQLRLKRAQEYLFYSRMNVGEIAVACGYTAPTIFCRAFKKQFKMSPTEYRTSTSVEGLRRLNHDYRSVADAEIRSTLKDRPR